MPLSPLQRQRVAQYVRGYLLRTSVNYGRQATEHRALWRWMHTLNVAQNIRLIAEGEQCSEDTQDVCEIAALFHDVDHYTVELQYHGVRGAETAARFLKKEGYPAEFITRVADAVRGHHFDLDDDMPVEEQMAEITKGLGLEAKLLMDAETLDKLGVANVLQSVITMSELKHPQVHEVAKELSAGWPLQRARDWQQTLVTATGKRMGAERLAFYAQFAAQIEREIVINDPYPQPSAQTQEMLQIP